ncbi:MAG TPA: propionyl-CoA carboxylase subunit beta, partial [Actinobacteria bacterium]|nr:propionyl-CoA carboxylase subunit beta [Actinomycetota bacterium]
ADSEQHALDEARRLCALLGDQGTLEPSSVTDIDLNALLPESAKRAYDVHPLVDALLDEDTDIELHPKWAPNIVTALGRLGGRTVGVIANNP